MKILLIDNYDSFTFNLFQYFAELTGDVPHVYYNNKLSLRQFEKLKPDAIVISPGPGDPREEEDFGICSEIIQRTTVPLLGVCLGHQGIGVAFGAQIQYAPEVMHGRASNIYHTEGDLFHNIPQGFEAIRYHSLLVSNKDLPKELVKTAWTDDGVIMGLQHKKRPLYGIQFHPESIGTGFGKKILTNFLERIPQK
ncbi:MAG TPA: aminodeoxychorismate/anthranilate synthase component II [Candidatus Sulfotelmatobacter sp.]|jgi:anthranilate synthase component 2|nr:aminodeoxychorismate/anthranilate synthase component II [Candidatus Sulfotelmatobacter sp.]